MVGELAAGSDEDLLAAVTARQAGAWLALQRGFERIIVGCVRNAIRRYRAFASEEGIEDLVGTVLLNLVKDDHGSLRAFDPGRGYRLSSWIGLVATNTALDSLRRRALSAAPLDADEGAAEGRLANGAPSPSEALERRRQWLALLTAIRALPYADQELLRLYYDDELEPDQIAGRLGITVNTVSSRKNDLREDLRRPLDGAGEVAGKVQDGPAQDRSVSQPKAPDRPSEARDAMDRRITRALRQPPLPAPSADEPADDLILRVLDGWASEADRARVAAAPLAADKLAILREAGGAAEPGPLHAAARYVFAVATDVLELLRGATAPPLAPQAAWTVRSGAAAAEPVCEFHHPFQSIDAHVRVEQVSRPGTPPTLDLQVRLTEAGAPLDRARVTLLRHGGRTLDSVPTDPSGAALFTGLAPDRYEVELRHAGGVAGVLLLDFLRA